MDHLEPIRQRIRAAPVSEPPPPWIASAVHAIGGLTEIGFADDTDLLLVVSHQGRGVLDCHTGQRIARDWYDERRLRAFLGGPWGSIFDGKTPFAKLSVEGEVRAFGFSDTGDCLVLATSSDLTIYRHTF
jgi:hypothetical protein